MKQRFLLALIFVCAFMVNTKAQISKGSVWVGGSIGYNQNKNDYKDPLMKDYKATSFNVSPAIGFAVKDNLIVGFGLSYGNEKLKNGGTISDSKSNSYGGRFFVRQYIPVINRLYLFGEASAGFSATKGDETQPDVNGPLTTTTKGWNTVLNLTPGLAFAITKKFQIETSLSSLANVNYSKTKTTTDRPSAYSYNNKTNDLFGAGILTDGKIDLNIGCRFLL